MSDLQSENMETARVPETLPEQKSAILLLDLDGGIYKKEQDNEQTVKAKVEIANQVFKYLAHELNRDIIPVILTQRPAQAVLEHPLIKHFLGLRNFVKSPDGKIAAREMPLVLCELGSVQLHYENGQWAKKIDSGFETYRQGVRKDLVELLKEKYVDTGLCQFEEGTDVCLALQLNGSCPKTKKEIADEVEALLKEKGREDLLGKVVIETDGMDVDFIPQKLQERAKGIGVDAALKYFQEHGYPNLQHNSVILADDTRYAAGKAAEVLFKKGGKTIVPSNAESALKEIIERNGGIISPYDTFWGTIDGVFRALTGKQLNVPWMDTDSGQARMT